MSLRDAVRQDWRAAMDEAVARAGGAAGNKGQEAAEAALRAADLLMQLELEPDSE